MGTAFDVVLEASDDGGQTYTVRPRAMTGDVGPRVSPGAGKTIVWDSTKDVDDLQADRYVFRVRVSASGPNAAVASAPAPSGTTPAAGQGATAGIARRSDDDREQGGLGKGALIGIIGGGTAAGVGVAVSKRKGSSSGQSSASSGQSSAPSQNLPIRTFTGPFSFQLIVVIANPDGSAACSQTFGHDGSLTMTVQVSGGSVTGTAALIDRSTVLSSTCGPSVGITDSGFTVGNVPVNGAPASLVFTREIIDRGMEFTRTQTVSFLGVLTAETISGTLTLRYQGDGASVGNPRISQGNATVPVTLR